MMNGTDVTRLSGMIWCAEGADAIKHGRVKDK